MITSKLCNTTSSLSLKFIKSNLLAVEAPNKEPRNLQILQVLSLLFLATKFALKFICLSILNIVPNPPPPKKNKNKIKRIKFEALLISKSAR